MKKEDQKLLDDIAEIGWHVIKVPEDTDGPAFAYSIGLYKSFNHPEILIVGLKTDLAQTLINNMAEDIRNGKVYQSGEYYDDILEGINCFMLDVSKDNYGDYVGYALWYYKNADFPLLQCLYPTTQGVYPWESEWPEDIKELQPVLGDLE